jgi:hypothetical protein
MFTMLLCTNKIAESQRELLQAREMIDEAQRSLSSSLEEESFGDMSSGDVDEDSKRIESVKAAAVSSIVGGLASFPYLSTKLKICHNYSFSHQLFS